MLTPGNVADITAVILLLEGAHVSRIRPKRLIADKAYDANSLRKWLKQRRIRAVIPSTAARTKPFPLDHKAYRRRNLVERLIGWLKNLAAHRHAIRSPREKLSRRSRPRKRSNLMDLNESAT